MHNLKLQSQYSNSAASRWIDFVYSDAQYNSIQVKVLQKTSEQIGFKLLSVK